MNGMSELEIEATRSQREIEVCSFY
jgi:hypothetical protein